MQTSTAFGNIIGNGKACGTDLPGIAIEFSLLKVISHFVKTDCKSFGQLPNFKIFKTKMWSFHLSSSFFLFLLTLASFRLPLSACRLPLPSCRLSQDPPPAGKPASRHLTPQTNDTPSYLNLKTSREITVKPFYATRLRRSATPSESRFHRRSKSYGGRDGGQA
ncbi:MAG: hypothetical protein V1897_06680 [Pseudomonadota bacterium]